MPFVHPQREPNWGTFLQFVAFSRQLSIVDMAALCTTPRGTIAVAVSGRGVRRPREDVAKKIGRGLNIPGLAVFGIAGYADRLSPTMNTTSSIGGLYLRWVREHAQKTREEAVALWNQQWPHLTATSEEWNRLEQHGTLPISWNDERYASLSHLPGAWIFALLAAISDHPEPYVDFVGLLFALRRFDALSLLAFQAWDTESYGPLTDAWAEAKHARALSETVARFAEAVRCLSFPVAQLKSSARDKSSNVFPNAPNLGDLSDHERGLIARYRTLTDPQKYAVDQIVGDLAHARLR